MGQIPTSGSRWRGLEPDLHEGSGRGLQAIVRDG